MQAAAREFRPFKGFKAGKRQAWTPNNRGLWRQTAGCNALATKACGRSAWCKQPRGILGLLKVLRLANGRLERPNNRGLWRQTAGCNALAAGLWPECLVQAAATEFRPFKDFKAANGRLDSPNNRGLWRQTAGCNALATKACGRSAWCKQPRGISDLLRVLRLANGRLERPNNRGLWRQTAGCNALAAGLWRER